MAQLTPDFYEALTQLNDAGYAAKATTGPYGIEVTVTSPEGDTLDFSSSKTDPDAALTDFTVAVYERFKFVNDDLAKTAFSTMLERRARAWEAAQADNPDWDPDTIANAHHHADQAITDANAAGQHTDIIKLTRELAAELLWRHQLASDRRGFDRDPDLQAFLTGDYKARQRRQSEPHLRKLINALKDNEWKLTHQGLAVARDGFLIDGQHRCMAVAISGIPAPIRITHNMDDDIFTVVDTGKPRSAADIFAMLGIKYPNHVSTVIRLLYFYDNEPFSNWFKKPSSPEHLREQLVDHYSDIGGFFERARSLTASKHQPVLLAPTALAAAIYIITRAWPDAPLEPFLTNLKNGNIDPYYHDIYPKDQWDNNPGHALARWANAIAIESRTKGTRRKSREQKNSRDLVMILRAWNDINAGKVVNRYKWDDSTITAPTPYRPIP